MRCAFDFETYGWEAEKTVNPLSCAFVWGPPGERKEYWLHDDTREQPLALGQTVLRSMHSLVLNEGIKEFWAHNLGKFDGLFLLGAAYDMGWKMDGILASGSRVISLDLYPPKSNDKVVCKDSALLVESLTNKRESRDYEDDPVRIFDSFNLVPSALGHKSVPCGGCCACDFELASKKLFTNSVYAGDMRDLRVEDLRAGNLADCHLVLELIEKVETLVEDFGGKLKRTFASTAMGIVQKRLKKEGYKQPDFRPNKTNLRAKRGLGETLDRVHINEMANEATYGGRVEVFHHMPIQMMTELDVCSSYPSSMCNPLPWDYMGRTRSHKDIEKRIINDEMMIVQATVNVPKTCWIPPLPYQAEKTTHDGLFFPTGKWTGWWTGVELAYAMTLGVTAQFHEAHVFTKESPFTSFIHELYALKDISKREGKKALTSFVKFLLNGSYGKFGESPEHEKLHVFADEYEAADYQDENPNVKVTVSGHDGRFASVSHVNWSATAHYAIAAHITAYSRILIHKGAMNAHGLAYMDTDSLHCEAYRGDTGSALGQLKYELTDDAGRSLFYAGKFYAPKIYRLVEVEDCIRAKCIENNWPKEDHEGKKHVTRACKGFPTNDEAFSKMVGSAVDPEVFVRVERMQLMKSQLKSKTPGLVKRVGQNKRWGGYSVKRRPFQDGETEPWDVKEIAAGKHSEARSPLIAR